MQRTVWLTGMLPFVLIIGAGLTVLLAIPLLWLYRRAVLRSMRRAAGSASPVAAPPAPVQRASGRAIGGLLQLLLATGPAGDVRHDDVAVVAS
jgi:hypothetical protein